METLERFSQFREALYQACSSRGSALLELIDAVAQTPRPHSPAELSLAMQRHWTTLYDALRHGGFDLDVLRPLLVKTAHTAAPYRVAGGRVVVVDHSGYPRPAARTVAERERYHGPNDSRPVGHRYSWLSQLVDDASPWVAPLDVERIGPTSTPVGTALTQVERLAKTSDDPLLVVGDREYGVNEILRRVRQVPGVPVTWVTRLRTNLVFYQAPPPRAPGQKGRPRQYGARVQLNDPTTWPDPAWRVTEPTPSGERVELRGWADWRRRGIAETPVQIVQVRVLRADGQPKYAQPLWLMVVGQLDWVVIAPVYRRRWCEETWHAQAKELLGWSRAQLGDVERQDRWTWVVLLAAWPLLLARDVARDCPRPWERRVGSGPLPLARVQRDYGRILREFGLGVPAPKPRGKAPGRPPGTRLEPKPRQPLLQRRLKAA
ncbi:MAG: transposase [Chloroflexota bacterium]|nr:transposase [Chloroflexota bacterium]